MTKRSLERAIRSSPTEAEPTRGWKAPPKAHVFTATFTKDAEEYRALLAKEVKRRIAAITQIDERLLLRLGKSDAQAEADLELFVERTIYAVNLLNTCVESIPERIAKIAAKRATWPVLSSDSPKVVAANQRLIQRLGVGSSVSLLQKAAAQNIIKTEAKQFAVYLAEIIRAIRIASQLMVEVQGEHDVLHACLADSLRGSLFAELKYTEELRRRCVSLPELSTDKAVVAAWWKVAKEILMLNTDGCPENLPALCQLGEHRRYHPTTKIDREKLDKHAMGVAQQNKNIRTEIKDRLKEQFEILARQVSTTVARKAEPRKAARPKAVGRKALGRRRVPSQ